MAIDFLYKKAVIVVFWPFVGVHFVVNLVKKMPKVNQLSMTRTAIRARERRDVNREEQRYNSTLKEFIEYKYSHIIEEFNPFYEELKAKYPEKRVYVNTNEFRLWRKREIQKAFNNDGVEVVSFDSTDLNGKDPSDSDEFTNSEHHGEQEQHGEQQHDEQEHHGEQEQHGEQQHDEDNNNNILAVAIEQAANEVDQIIRELQNGDVPLLGDDEGIDLDIYEEIQGDIEEFNYGLEVELNDW